MISLFLTKTDTLNFRTQKSLNFFFDLFLNLTFKIKNFEGSNALFWVQESSI